MAAPILQFKRGSGVGVAGTVPGLRPGEPAFTTNNYDFFVGLDTSISGNKFFGSHRYWQREDGSKSLRMRLVAADGSTSNSISLKTLDAHTGVTTYTLPSTPDDGKFLQVDGTGIMSWVSVTAGGSFTNSTFTGITTFNSSGFLDVNSDADFSGITTFSNTTDNTLGIPTTGAVQVRGGVGISKNLTVGAGLSVTGQSHFIGTATFYGGTINLGDSTSDNIVFSGRIHSDLVPDEDNTHDVGISTLNWRHAWFSGIGTFETGAVVDAIQIGISGASEIDTTTGGLTLDSASGQTTIDDNLSVTGIATFTQGLTGTISTATRATTVDTTATSTNATYYVPFVSNSSSTIGETIRVGSGISFNPSTNTLEVLNLETTTIKHTNGTTSISIDTLGNVGMTTNLTIDGNLLVKGSTTTVNTTQLKVEDPLIELGMVDDGSGGLIAPSTNTTTDVGTVLHYYNDGSAKKAAFFWDKDTTRVSIAQSVTESSTLLTVTDWGTLEIGSLLMNGKLTVNDCAGSSDVITCSGTERSLSNITIDCGSF